MTLPLTAVRFHSVDLPVMVTWSLRKRAWLLITAPVRRWQAKQWHMALREGSPSMVRWSCPQLQAAWRVIVRLHDTGVQGYWSGARSRIPRDGAAGALLRWLSSLRLASTYGSLKGSTPTSRLGLSEDCLLRLYSQCLGGGMRLVAQGGRDVLCRQSVRCMIGFILRAQSRRHTVLELAVDSD